MCFDDWSKSLLRTQIVAHAPTPPHPSCLVKVAALTQHPPGVRQLAALPPLGKVLATHLGQSQPARKRWVMVASMVSGCMAEQMRGRCVCRAPSPSGC